MPSDDSLLVEIVGATRAVQHHQLGRRRCRGIGDVEIPVRAVVLPEEQLRVRRQNRFVVVVAVVDTEHLGGAARCPVGRPHIPLGTVVGAEERAASITRDDQLVDVSVARRVGRRIDVGQQGRPRGGSVADPRLLSMDSIDDVQKDSRTQNTQEADVRGLHSRPNVLHQRGSRRRSIGFPEFATVRDVDRREIDGSIHDRQDARIGTARCGIGIHHPGRTRDGAGRLPEFATVQSVVGAEQQRRTEADEVPRGGSGVRVEVQGPRGTGETTPEPHLPNRVRLHDIEHHRLTDGLHPGNIVRVRRVRVEEAGARRRTVGDRPPPRRTHAHVEQQVVGAERSDLIEVGRQRSDREVGQSRRSGSRAVGDPHFVAINAIVGREIHLVPGHRFQTSLRTGRAGAQVAQILGAGHGSVGGDQFAAVSDDGHTHDHPRPRQHRSVGSAILGRDRRHHTGTTPDGVDGDRCSIVSVDEQIVTHDHQRYRVGAGGAGVHVAEHSGSGGGSIGGEHLPAVGAVGSLEVQPRTVRDRVVANSMGRPRISIFDERGRRRTGPLPDLRPRGRRRRRVQRDAVHEKGCCRDVGIGRVGVQLPGPGRGAV